MTKWSEEKEAELRRLYLGGEPRAVIAAKLGFTECAIKHRVEMARYTKDETRQRRAAYKALRNLRLKDERASPYDYSRNRATDERPSEAELAERGARLSIPPRDLTAALCGDPRPGYSALERRV